jgi:two-component system phosphate regulon sensor histidine kinase PhoR
MDGLILADTSSDIPTLAGQLRRPEIRKTLETGDESATVSADHLHVCVPLEHEGSTTGVLRASVPFREITGLFAGLRSRVFLMGFIGILLSLGLSLLLSRRLARPIREITRGARQIASGDFNVSVDLENQDEIKKLADSFNDMSIQIKRLFFDLSLQKEELTSIISSIQEGLIVVDSSGSIVFGNGSFTQILGHDRFSGKKYWEILRNQKLCDLIKSVGDEKQNRIEEVEFFDHVFLCSATFIVPKNEIVLIFHDITEKKQLERIKKDFVVNVSHELRTPLTALKGYIETLSEEIEEEHRYYMAILQRHTDRLINIVEDLLILSELEETSLSLEKEDVRLDELMRNIKHIFDKKIGDKGLQLSITVPSDTPPLSADPFKLEQLFINLIENAAKYTEKGVIQVSVAPAVSNGTIAVRIEDSGIGIPPEHLENIFERFFVVDKSRSRKMGGTGLGLSIVKHILRLHNGSISVESTPGIGTAFTVRLPVSRTLTIN